MSNHKKTKNPESKFLDGNVQMCVYYRADGTSIIERKVHTVHHHLCAKVC